MDLIIHICGGAPGSLEKKNDLLTFNEVEMPELQLQMVEERFNPEVARLRSLCQMWYIYYSRLTQPQVCGLQFLIWQRCPCPCRVGFLRLP